MDGHVAWYRAQLRRAVTRRLAAEALALAVLGVGGFVMMRPTLSPAVVPAGVVGVCATRLVLAAYTNPLDRRRLRRYLTDALDCVPVPMDGAVAPAAAPLLEVGYAAVAAVGGSADDTVHYDLLATGNALVLAVVARASGSVLLLSRVPDGRVVVSSTLQVLPAGGLVSNTVAGASVDELHRSHWELLRLLVASPLDLMPVPHGTFVAVLAEERAAHRVLGPLATFADLTCRGRSARFVVSVSPERVRALGLAPTSHERPAPSTRFAPQRNIPQTI